MASGIIEQKLAALGLTLPVLPASKGIYKSCLIQGNLIYVSGHVSVNTDGTYITGKLGKDIDEEHGQTAARPCGLAMLASLSKHLGGLDRVKGVVKLLGMVIATRDYEKHPIVINGCSALFAELWGEALLPVRCLLPHQQCDAAVIRSARDAIADVLGYSSCLGISVWGYHNPAHLFGR